MIFNNLGLSDLSLKLELFLWQIVGLLMNFSLSIGGNNLKVLSKLLLDKFGLLTVENFRNYSF